MCSAAEREAVAAAERAERKHQLREKVSIASFFLTFKFMHNRSI